MNKLNKCIVFGLMLTVLSGCCCLKENPTESQETSNAAQSPAGSAPADFVGVWQVKKICKMPDASGNAKDHHEIGHGPDGTPHVKEGGWYSIYPKREDGPDTIYGIMISEEFADYNDLPELIDWNNIELHYRRADEPELPTGPFRCVGTTADVNMLTTEVGPPSKRPKLHGQTEHVVQIYLHKDSDLHPGETAPVISFTHTGGTGLHAGMLH